MLGARERKCLIPPDVDVFELGLIDRPGPHELLLVDEDGKPLWDEVIHLLVSEAEAARQREHGRFRDLARILDPAVVSDRAPSPYGQADRERADLAVLRPFNIATICKYITGPQ